MSTKDLQWKKYRDEHYLYKNESDKVPDWFKANTSPPRVRGRSKGRK